MKGSAEHSRCTCEDGPSRSADEQIHNNPRHRKGLRKKTTACVSLFVFFTIRRGTFPYSIEDDASSTSQTPTTHNTNTCVKLTIVTDLSFSERIAISNLSSYNSITTCLSMRCTVICFELFGGLAWAINVVSVRHDYGFLPDIILLTQGYILPSGNPFQILRKRFCICSLRNNNFIHTRSGKSVRIGCKT